MLSIAVAFALFILVAFLIYGFTLYMIAMEEKAKVNQTKKVEMAMCDKHGVYPRKYSLLISAPQEGKIDLVVEVCPFCYKERMDSAQAILAEG